MAITSPSASAVVPFIIIQMGPNVLTVRQDFVNSGFKLSCGLPSHSTSMVMPGRCLRLMVFCPTLGCHDTQNMLEKKTYKEVQVGNDQEKEQSERNSHSKNRGVGK